MPPSGPGATSRGATIVGDSVMRLQRADLPELAVPGPVHVFDWSRSADLELMQAFVESADDDDLDEAEVAMDELDDQGLRWPRASSVSCAPD